MRKGLLAALAGAVAMMCADQALAATVYNFTLTGTVTSGYGTDGLVNVGDTVTMTAHIAADYIFNTSTPGVQVTGAWANFKPLNWSLSAGGYTWNPSDDEYDGEDQFLCVGGICLAGPQIQFSGDKIVSVSSPPMFPATGTRPEIDMYPSGFSIHDTNLYSNHSSPQSFWGTWDFADSSVIVTGVPEPTTWAMMLIGFFGLGAALRTRRVATAA